MSNFSRLTRVRMYISSQQSQTYPMSNPQNITIQSFFDYVDDNYDRFLKAGGEAESINAAARILIRTKPAYKNYAARQNAIGEEDFIASYRDQGLFNTVTKIVLPQMIGMLYFLAAWGMGIDEILKNPTFSMAMKKQEIKNFGKTLFTTKQLCRGFFTCKNGFFEQIERHFVNSDSKLAITFRYSYRMRDSAKNGKSTLFHDLEFPLKDLAPIDVSEAQRTLNDVVNKIDGHCRTETFAEKLPKYTTKLRSIDQFNVIGSFFTTYLIPIYETHGMTENEMYVDVFNRIKDVARVDLDTSGIQGDRITKTSSATAAKKEKKRLMKIRSEERKRVKTESVFAADPRRSSRSTSRQGEGVIFAVGSNESITAHPVEKSHGTILDLIVANRIIFEKARYESDDEEHVGVVAGSAVTKSESGVVPLVVPHIERGADASAVTKSESDALVVPLFVPQIERDADVWVETFAELRIESDDDVSVGTFDDVAYELNDTFRGEREDEFHFYGDIYDLLQIEE